MAMRHEPGAPGERTEDGHDPWGRSRRVVAVRPHLWRWIAAAERGPVLEVGPGLRPTAPLHGSYFVDRSPHVLGQLAARGGRISQAAERLPFPDGRFGVVLAFEVLEHVPDDHALLQEIARVLRPGGMFVLSTPIRPSLWSALDEACGHVRRYEPDDLFRKVRASGLVVEGYAAAPAASRILSRARARVLVGNRGAATALVQGVVFPLQAAYQRSFGQVRWVSPQVPVPPDAGDLTVHARLRTEMESPQPDWVRNRFAQPAAERGD